MDTGREFPFSVGGSWRYSDLSRYSRWGYTFSIIVSIFNTVAITEDVNIMLTLRHYSTCNIFQFVSLWVGLKFRIKHCPFQYTSKPSYDK